jgi:hypothetical protein
MPEIIDIIIGAIIYFSAFTLLMKTMLSGWIAKSRAKKQTGGEEQ